MVINALEIGESTYVVDIFGTDELHDSLKVRFAGADALLEQSKCILAQIQLIHDLVKAGLYLWSKHVVSRSDCLIPEYHLLIASSRDLLIS